MTAVARAFNIYRPNERQYIAELDSIRWEIDFLENFICESPSHRSLAPMVEVLTEKVSLIERALCEPELPPLPDELRNPYTRPRTPEEQEYIRGLIKKYSGKRRKPVPVE